MRGYSLVRVGGLVVVGWLFFLAPRCFGGVIVIHWLTEWSDSGGGVVLGESWDEDPVWLGWWLLYLMWFMEFGVTACDSDSAGGPRVVVVGITGVPRWSGQSWFTIIDWSLWWLLWFVECETLLRGWLVGWVMNDEWWMMIRWFRWSMIPLFQLRFTCYLLPCSLTLWETSG